MRTFREAIQKLAREKYDLALGGYDTRVDASIVSYIFGIKDATCYKEIEREYNELIYKSQQRYQR